MPILPLSEGKPPLPYHPTQQEALERRTGRRCAGSTCRNRLGGVSPTALAVASPAPPYNSLAPAAGEKHPASRPRGFLVWGGIVEAAFMLSRVWR